MTKSIMSLFPRGVFTEKLKLHLHPDRRALRRGRGRFLSLIVEASCSLV